MEISKRVPGIEPALCRLRDLRLYRSLHEEVSYPVRLLDPVHLFISEKFLLCAIIFLKKIHLTFLFFAGAGNI